MSIDWFSFGIGAAAGWIAACIAWLVDYHWGFGLFAYMKSQHRSMVDVPLIKHVPDELVRLYMQRHWPGWSWKWTTVGIDGRPQVLISRNGEQGRKWHLIAQKDIKL